MSRIRTINALLGLAGLVVIPLLTVSPVSAQQEEGAAALEEIVVTARRREESLQDVPVAIFALGTDDLELRGVEQIEDLDVMVPNVSLLGGGSEGEAEGIFIMRGIPGVATYIDGIWQDSTEGLLTLNVVEVDRIEVLRGPQGTLFGKNAVGGAVHYVTRAPAEEFRAKAKLTTGEYNRRDVVASLDLPLSDTVFTKFTGAQLTRDGFVKSLTIDQAYGDVNDTTFRGDLIWVPNDNIRLRFTADYIDNDRVGQARVLAGLIESTTPGMISRPSAYTVVGIPYTNLTHTSDFPGGLVGKYETRSDYTGRGIVQDFDRYAIDITVDINDRLAFKSLTGYRDMYRKTYIDFDGAEISLFERDRRAQSEFISQEFQLQGSGDRFNWVAGIYAWETDRVVRTLTWSFQEFRDDPSLAAALRAIDPRRSLTPRPGSSMLGSENDGLAFFGEVEISLTDKLNLTVGMRQNDETVSSFTYAATGAQLPPSPGIDPAGCFFCRTQRTEFSADFDSSTPRVSLAYNWNDSVMTYVSYAEGFGAGGIDVETIPGLPPDYPFDPEETENFEIGLRADLLDDRLRLNATYFTSVWSQIQVTETIFDPRIGEFLPNAVVRNAGAADADGLEIEGIIVASDALRFDFTVGILNTAYTDVGRATQIFPGATFQQAPDLTYSLGAQYGATLSNGGALTTRVDYGYVDDYVRVREAQRQTFQEDYALLSARVTYEPSAGDWRLSVFGSNLTEARYLNSGFISAALAFDLATVARPREAGVSLEFFFE